MSMWKIDSIFGLRTSRNSPNRQISHSRYAMGQPRSVTSDDLRKSKFSVNGQMWLCGDLNRA